MNLQTTLKAANLSALLLPLLLCSVATAQQAQPDELVFVNGERLLGRLERTDPTQVVFKSDMLGEIKAPWSSVRELRAPEKFAVIPKGTEFTRRRRETSKILQGALDVHDQKVDVTTPSGATQTTALADTGYLVDQKTFDETLQRPGIFEYWNGAVTAGAAVVFATQDSRTFTSGISLSRSIPTEPWMNPENRTSIDFSSSYGQLTQPGEPMVKTSIFHADAERDEYFTRNLYVFAAAAFDHNYSQGLDLEQTYGGGVGLTAVKTAADEFDLKGEATYVEQSFSVASSNQNLFASVFSEDYKHKFRRSVSFEESLSIAPAWTNLAAYTATGSAVLTIPISKKFSVGLNSLDTFLNDPPPGFRKNSFQFSTSLAYTLP